MEFLQPTSLAEALDLLAEYGNDACPLAGGTDLMIQLDRGERRTAALLHLGRLAGLDEIKSNGQLNIGALATHRQLATSPVIAQTCPNLATAAGEVGGWQTQNAGTLGGNICNASPAADLAAPLLVHDARVELKSRDRGERSLPLAEFVQGRRQTHREDDELVTGFSLEPLTANTADIYIKVGRRSATEVAIIGLALRLSLGDGDVIEDVRIATCATGPLPARATAVEKLLRGETLSSDLIRAAGDRLQQDCKPIDDTRASAWYRQALLPRVLEQALLNLNHKLVGAK